MSVIRLASRVSKLALIQTQMISTQLKTLDPTLEIEVVGIKTQGDKILDKSLAKIGGKGLFIKELEQALLDKRADFAVHSMKDVPFECAQGLEILAIGEREDPRDVLFSNLDLCLRDLPAGSVVGTSSLRRQMQLMQLRPDLKYKPIRGNVLTRLDKCRRGEFDAIVLAAAGMKRLDLGDMIVEYFEPTDCLPAVGQGAIGIEARSQDNFLKDIVLQLNHADTQACVLCERAMNATLKGSCSVPLAGFATIQGDNLSFEAKIGWPDGSKVLSTNGAGYRKDAVALGQKLAHDLLAQGAQEILDACQ